MAHAVVHEGQGLALDVDDVVYAGARDGVDADEASLLGSSATQIDLQTQGWQVAGSPAQAEHRVQGTSSDDCEGTGSVLHGPRQYLPLA